jgi:hypothetical protein
VSSGYAYPIAHAVGALQVLVLIKIYFLQQTFPGLAEPWIALVQRGGNCSFYDKIMYATAAGASAIIIGNVHMR